MRILRIFFLLLTGIFLFSSVNAGGGDISRQRAIHLKIKREKDGSLKLTSHTATREVFLTENSVDDKFVTIWETEVARVKNIKGTFRGDKIPKSHIFFESASSPDVFISNDKCNFIFVGDDIKPGDTLYYEYEEEYIDIAYLPLLTVPNKGFISLFAIHIEHPEDVTIGFDLFFPRDSLPYRVERPNATKTSLIFDSIAENRELSYFAFNDFHARILTTVLDNGRLANPVTPQAIMDWYWPRAKAATSLDSIHRCFLDNEILSNTTVADTLEAINAYVTSNIRYIANLSDDHGIYPHQPSRVLSLKYGDCKDRAFLVKALAREAGIDVYPVLISTDPYNEFDKTHLWLFNHIICAVREGDGVRFFDPTAKYCGWGTIPDNLIGQRALILDPDNPRYEVVPPPVSLPGLEIEISGDISRPDKMSARLVFRGYLNSMIRSLRQNLTDREFQSAIADAVEKSLCNIRCRDFMHEPDTQGVSTYRCTVDLGSFLIASGPRFYIPVSVFNLYGPSLAERADDPYPVQAEHAFTGVLDFAIFAPAVSIVSDSTAVGHSEADYFTSSIEPMANDSIRVHYEIRGARRDYDLDSKADLLGFYNSYQKLRNKMYIVEGESR